MCKRSIYVHLKCEKDRALMSVKIYIHKYKNNVTYLLVYKHEFVNEKNKKKDCLFTKGYKVFNNRLGSRFLHVIECCTSV